MADFNNTNITLVFEPDEDGEINELSARIFITDDAINEATEQVFVAELILVSSLDPATVDLTIRTSTLCSIIDNDRRFKSTVFNLLLLKPRLHVPNQFKLNRIKSRLHAHA